MLDDPKAKQGDEFVSEWLRLRPRHDAARERRMFPLFSRDLVASTEAGRFVRDLVWSNESFMDALRRTTVSSARSRRHLQSQRPARVSIAWNFPPKPTRRAPGQALFSRSPASPSTAPTARGLFVRESGFCQHVPPPPRHGYQSSASRTGASHDQSRAHGQPRHQ
jgi:hypothetical protein